MDTHFLTSINSFSYLAFIFVSLLAITYGYYYWFPERNKVDKHWNLFRSLQIIGVIGYGAYLGFELPVLLAQFEQTDRSFEKLLAVMSPLLLTTILVFVSIFLASFGITKLWLIVCKKK